MRELKSDFDLIEGTRVCRLRPSMLPEEPTSGGWGCIGAVFLALVLVFIASYYTIKSILAGLGWPSLVFPGILAGVFLLLVVLGPIQAFREGRFTREALPEPVQQIGEVLRSRAPENATLCRVRATFDGPGVIAYGWMWFDGAWIRFRGDRFDFDLTREQAKLFVAESRLIATVHLPAKLGTHQVRVATECRNNRTLKERISPALRDFEEAPIGPGKPILEALHRDVPEVRHAQMAAWSFLAGAPLPALLIMSKSLIPDLRASDPGTLSFMFLAFFLLTWLTLHQPRWSAIRANAKVDRAIAASYDRNRGLCE